MLIRLLGTRPIPSARQLVTGVCKLSLKTASDASCAKIYKGKLLLYSRVCHTALFQAKRKVGPSLPTARQSSGNSLDNAAGAEKSPHSSVKRRVALHLGYVGTDFKGLQFIRRDDAQGIEDIVEPAIAASGGILPSNVGQAHRTKWTRSSRTDKGVHSLSTVIGLNMEISGDGVFDADSEGQELASAINQHLPSQVRVFSVQRVNKSFSARHYCQNRTYQYHIPVRILGLTGGTEDGAILKRLQDCLDGFYGRHPFHNYTVRKLYRSQKLREDKARKDVKWKERTDWMRKDINTAAYSTMSVLEGSDSLHMDPERENSEYGDPSEGADKSVPTFRYWCAWVKGDPGADKIDQAHFRRITAISASGPRQLVPGGEDCVTISITGASFMVYQIRHMMAVAICIAVQQLPSEFVEASLSLYSRMKLPLAPPLTLVLSDCRFQPFPVQASQGNSPVIGLSGESLELRSHGKAQQEAFVQEVFAIELDKLLKSQEWDDWRQSLMSLQDYDASEWNTLLENHKAHSKNPSM